ncbi:hypothetical protein GQ44DRAFT_729899 [Phaeosphaeriaceae sp. PMI808]|nr:hypothetical protein GQ44DRAFT_729899 [Phaeosphaeriaceae sp. PMI808]
MLVLYSETEHQGGFPVFSVALSVIDNKRSAPIRALLLCKPDEAYRNGGIAFYLDSTNSKVVHSKEGITKPGKCLGHVSENLNELFKGLAESMPVPETAPDSYPDPQTVFELWKDEVLKAAESNGYFQRNPSC